MKGVTIIVPCYKAGGYILDLYKSVAVQTISNLWVAGSSPAGRAIRFHFVTARQVRFTNIKLRCPIKSILVYYFF